MQLHLLNSRSAPENPGVPLATVLKFTSGDILILACTFNIFSLPIISGFETTTCLSNLPGLRSAGSSTSGLLVAAIIITPHLYQNHPFQLITDSLFALFHHYHKSCSLLLPTASISSIKIIHGECFFLAQTYLLL